MPATDKYNEVLIGVIAGLVIFLVITCMVVFILLFYQKKKFQHRKQIIDMERDFSSALLNSQIEIQEQTFNDISSEIHDNVGQILSLAKIQVNILKEKGVLEPELLGGLKENIGKAMNDLRDIARSLSSERLASIKIIDAVVIEVERINKTGAALVTIEVNGNEKSLAHQKKFILFRIIQECLQNILKHASATKIGIKFNYLTECLETEIEDDGIGFNVSDSDTKKNGLGLANIKSRATLSGGNCIINSSKGFGTKIIIKVPYE